MDKPVKPTPFADVNQVLNYFLDHTQSLLQHHFLGMYVIGSLALGDFHPATSDIDFVVVTDTSLEQGLVRGLQDIHAQFAASHSPWASKIEAVYAPKTVLNSHPPLTESFPQIEKGTPLLPATLEPGWVFQCWTLRERGVVVAGPDPQTLVTAIELEAMATAVVTIAGGWLHSANHDPTWLVWLRQPQHHTFVIQTLCRMLYSLANREVASKPRAVQWAQDTLDMPWARLIQHSCTEQAAGEHLSPSETEETIAFIAYTVQQAKDGTTTHKTSP